MPGECRGYPDVIDITGFPHIKGRASFSSNLACTE
jgi:hypothetical protein